MFTFEGQLQKLCELSISKCFAPSYMHSTLKLSISRALMILDFGLLVENKDVSNNY